MITEKTEMRVKYEQERNEFIIELVGTKDPDRLSYIVFDMLKYAEESDIDGVEIRINRASLELAFVTNYLLDMVSELNLLSVSGTYDNLYLGFERPADKYDI